MKVNKNYFNELSEQITNTTKWSHDKFIVFNHEAGTGKSTSTHRIVGEMTTEQGYRVLYVQRFTKDNELENTVESINRHAGRKVAVSYTGVDTRKVKAKELLIDRQVICITHQMYLQICKGEHQYLVKNRDVLIIDEYPDLLEKITITSNEIGQLWTECNKRGVPGIGGWALMLRDLKDNESISPQVMNYIDFSESRYKVYMELVKSAIYALNDEHSKVYIGILKKSLHLLQNGGYLFEDGFHTFDSDKQFMLLKNNIILDANAAFDYRYKLSKRFDVRKQEKIYDYAKDTLHHIQINTTKKEMKKFDKLFHEALKEVKLAGKNGVLFVTDMENVEKLKSEIIQFYLEHGNSIEEIEKGLNCKIKIDYFGNIIGVNHYRDYDAVVILKTPNFDYLTYASTYHYYSRDDNKEVNNIQIFKHEVVEAIRRSTVAGEIYQAIKRINRDNNKCADIYVFSVYQDAIDMVVEQLPNIQYNKKSHGVEQKNVGSYDKTERVKYSKSEKAKVILLEAQKKGIEIMQKMELRNLLEIKSGGNLTKILDKLDSFLKENGITHNGQQIVFYDNFKDPKKKDLNESA